MLEKLEIIRDLSTLFGGADVHLMPNSEDEVRTYLSQNVSRRLGTDLGKHPAVGQICTLDSDSVYEFLPFPGIAAIVYSCQAIEKILFVGPVVTESYSTNTFLAYLQQQGISQRTVTQLVQTASQLPMVPIHTLYRMVDILLKHLCKTEFPIPIKKMEPSYDFVPFASLNDSYQSKDIRQIRQIENRYETSSVLTEAVKLGNLSLALQTLRNHSMEKEMSMRSHSPLRNMQNYCIVLNTQLRHSLEGSGIHPCELDQLSNEIGVQIERMNTPDMAVPFSTYIIEQYCRLVQEQSYRQLSPLTHQTVIYIKNNLHANLTVKDTAKELSIHPDYLSHQFSKEMGMTFIAFLNQERCKQAASFLKHTSLQIKQISAIVGFNTISYFTKQFSHFYQKTPRDYRNERIFRQ